MAYTTIDDPSAYFQTKLYTGTGSSLAITNDGNSNLQPDLVWLKRRDGSTYDHRLNDSVRGVSKTIYSSDTFAENTSDAQVVTSFDSNGFTLGTSAGSNGSGVNNVAWQWKASGSTASNTDGSITSTVSANTTAGFSIVSYTGTGSNATVGHGLNSTLSMIIWKNRSASNGWIVYHHKNTSAPETDYLELHSTNGTNDLNTIMNDTAPTSSVFTVGTEGAVNNSGNNFIAYCFAEKKGYSKISSYVGNGSTSGTYVHLGFKPAFLMTKRTDTTSNWHMYDNKRDVDNGVTFELRANTSDAETDVFAVISQHRADFLSNGFKVKTTESSMNASGGTYIYMAFAENPFVSSTGIPTTAR